MSFGTATLQTHTAKVGSCPHGMPQGACPICNGMAGGNSTTKRDTPRNVGEMTYNQCAAIGAMLKAQKYAKEQAKIAQKNHLQVLANIQKTIELTHQRLLDLADTVAKTTPPIIARPISFVLTNIIGKTLNLIQNLTNTAAVFGQKIIQKFTDITDKLTAIYGEIKAAVQKKVSEFLSVTKKKLKSLFFVFGTEDTDDEKIDEVKKAFKMKTFIHKLWKNFKKKEEKEEENAG